MTRSESIAFYKAHSLRLFNISRRIVRDSGEAEEIMQDTILKFVTSSFTSGNEAQVSAWLAKTCIRKSIDFLRKKKKEDLFLQEYAVTAGSETGEENIEYDISKIRKAMDLLNDPYRLILNLVLIEKLDYQEIAEITGEKEATLRVQYSRGKGKLLDLLKTL